MQMQPKVVLVVKRESNMDDVELGLESSLMACNEISDTSLACFGNCNNQVIVRGSVFAKSASCEVTLVYIHGCSWFDTAQSLKRFRFCDHHVFAPANLFSHAIWDTVKLKLLLQPSPSIAGLGISLTDGDQHTLEESFDRIKKVLVGRQIIEDNAESLNEKISYLWCKLKEAVGKTDGQDDQKVVGIAIKVTDLYCRNISFISTSSSYLKDGNGVATLLIYSPQKKINETMMVFDLRYDTYSEIFHQFNDGDFAWLSTFYVIYIDSDEFEMVLETPAILIIFQGGHVRMCVIKKENSYGVVVSSIFLNCDGAVLKLKRVSKLASLFKFSRIIQNGLNGAAGLPMPICKVAMVQQYYNGARCVCNDTKCTTTLNEIEIQLLPISLLLVTESSSAVLWVVTAHIHHRNERQIKLLEEANTDAIQYGLPCKDIGKRLVNATSLAMVCCAEVNHRFVTSLTNGFEQKLETTILIFDPGGGTLDLSLYAVVEMFCIVFSTNLRVGCAQKLHETKYVALISTSTIYLSGEVDVATTFVLGKKAGERNIFIFDPGGRTTYPVF